MISLEPGYYEDGKFGIRIENVMLVKEVNLEVYFVFVCCNFLILICLVVKNISTSQSVGKQYMFM